MSLFHQQASMLERQSVLIEEQSIKNDKQSALIEVSFQHVINIKIISLVNIHKTQRIIKITSTIYFVKMMLERMNRQETVIQELTTRGTHKEYIYDMLKRDDGKQRYVKRNLYQITKRASLRNIEQISNSNKNKPLYITTCRTDSKHDNRRTSGSVGDSGSGD